MFFFFPLRTHGMYDTSSLSREVRPVSPAVEVCSILSTELRRKSSEVTSDLGLAERLCLLIIKNRQ